ncbi:MAG: hypothetical protein WAV15_00715 [Minisyncoccia bacterium]
MKKKHVGYLKLYRYIALEYKKRMTDQEYRLFDVYVTNARWDKRDKERYGIVENLSLQDIQDEYLPEWSRSKISEIRKSLAKKKFLTKLPKNKTSVDIFWIYQAQVREAEQGFRLMEQEIQPTEQNIQQAEQQNVAKLKTEIKNISDKYRVIGL